MIRKKKKRRTKKTRGESQNPIEIRDKKRLHSFRGRYAVEKKGQSAEPNASQNKNIGENEQGNEP